MRGLRERAAGGEKFGHGGAVPIGKVGDEVEQGAAELEGVFEERGLLPGFLEPFAALGR